MPLDASAKKLLDFMRQQNLQPVHEVSVDVARAQSNIVRAKVQPPAPQLRRVEDGVMEWGERQIPYRLYSNSATDIVQPLVVFFHGGGFVLGGLDSHDIVCRQLCEASGCNVLAVDYRLAPENKFPAAVEDAVDAVKWAQAHAKALGADAERLAVAGDSAGGNLATVAAMRLKDEGLPFVKLQLLIYPVTDQAGEQESKTRYGQGYGLTLNSMEYYAQQYFNTVEERADWRASPLRRDDLSGQPDALVLTAGYDPLVDEGEAYALRLAQAGVRVTLKRFPGQIHGFISRGGMIPEAMEAIAEAASLLRQRFF
jgi:Esterase/lipase